MSKAFSDMTLDELLDPNGHECGCGLKHDTQLRFCRIGGGAIGALSEALSVAKSRKPFVVMDENTKKAAGDRVLALLDSAHIPYQSYVFHQGKSELWPDEQAVGALTMAFDPSCDSVLAVGSGVINDCCKVLAHAVNRRSLVVATAPSMDGYASDSASMIKSRMKVSLYNACPIAILADTDILRDAPDRLIKAGLGDMLAKYISLCEWRISSLVTGEYYCENIASLMRQSLSQIVGSAKGLMAREPEAMEAAVKGLILSGVAMSYAKISRPASGLEHYFSHLWEMFSLQGRVPASLHGEQVGVGTCLTLELYEHIKKEIPDRQKAQKHMAAFDKAAWEAQMKAIFAQAAGEVLLLEEKVHKNDPQKHAKRLERLIAHWPDIQSIIREELPSANKIKQLMLTLNMATTPEDICLDHQATLDAYFGSREIRDKYLTSSMLWDLGLLEQYAQYL